MSSQKVRFWNTDNVRRFCYGLFINYMPCYTEVCLCKDKIHGKCMVLFWRNMLSLWRRVYPHAGCAVSVVWRYSDWMPQDFKRWRPVSSVEIERILPWLIINLSEMLLPFSSLVSGVSCFQFARWLERNCYTSWTSNMVLGEMRHCMLLYFTWNKFILANTSWGVCLRRCGGFGRWCAQLALRSVMRMVVDKGGVRNFD